MGPEQHGEKSRFDKKCELTSKRNKLDRGNKQSEARRFTIEMRNAKDM